jgi:hypothetical protein
MVMMRRDVYEFVGDELAFWSLEVDGGDEIGFE